MPDRPGFARARTGALRPRVLHYLGTNVGMTGVETFVRELCLEQVEQSLQPMVMFETAGREELAQALEAHGVVVHPFPERPERPAFLPRKLRTAWQRQRIIRTIMGLLREVDVLHLHAVGITGLDALSAAGLARFKNVLITHHATLSWFEPHRNALSDATFALERRLAASVVTPYQAAGEEYVAAGIARARSHVIPFCVELGRYPGQARTITAGSLRLIVPARLVPGKGHGELLQAVARLAPRYPDLSLVIAGAGPSEQEITRQISELGLAGMVTLRGHVQQSDMPALYAAADLVVLPTYMPGETFPLSLLEGMASGLPVIGTRWFGIPDIIDHGHTGLLVEPRSVDSLTQAIENFLGDPAFYARASAQALARVGSHFGRTAVAEAYTQLYQSVPASS